MIPAIDQRRRSALRAYTFLEVVIFFAISGLLATIALGQLSDLDPKMKSLRDRRNAQALCTVAQSAQNLGLDMVVPGDIAATINNLVEGRTVPDGPFKGTVMKVSNLTEEEKTMVAFYLDIEHGMLVYEGFATGD